MFTFPHFSRENINNIFISDRH